MKPLLAIVLLLVVLGTTAENCGSAEQSDRHQTIHLADGTAVQCHIAERSPDNQGWICTVFTSFDDNGDGVTSDVTYYPDTGVSPSASPGF